MPTSLKETPLQVGELLAARINGDWHEVKIAAISVNHHSDPGYGPRPYVHIDLDTAVSNVAVAINYSLYCEMGWVIRLHG